MRRIEHALSRWLTHAERAGVCNFQRLGFPGVWGAASVLGPDEQYSYAWLTREKSHAVCTVQLALTARVRSSTPPGGQRRTTTHDLEIFEGNLLRRALGPK